MMDSRYKLKTGEEVAYFPPIQNTDNPYLTEAAMHADQANQLEGYGYLVDGVGAFTYLGTTAGTAADYEGFGGGSGLDVRGSNLASDLNTAEKDGIKTKLSIVDSSGGTVTKSTDVYTIQETQLPFKTSASAIDDNYIYGGLGDNLIKWNEKTGQEVIHTIAGTDEWRCMFISRITGYLYFSPSDGFNEGMAAADHGLYKYDGTTVTKVVQLGALENIWGIDEDTNGTIFCGVYTGGIVLNNNVYRGISGDNFTMIFDPHITGSSGNLNRHVHDVHVDRSNNYVYACFGDGISTDLNYRSVDGGDTWTVIIQNNPAQQMTAVLAVDGHRIFGSDRLNIGKIYISYDDITSIEVLSTHYQNCFFLKQSDVTGWVYAGFKLDPATTTNFRADLYISKDLGLTWTLYETIVSPSSSSDGYAYASDFKNGAFTFSFLSGYEYQEGRVINEVANGTPTNGVKTVVVSRELTEFDNNKILNILGDVFLTINNAKLQYNFQCDLDVLQGQVLFDKTPSTSIDAPFGNKLILNKQGSIYRKKQSNSFRLIGQFERPLIPSLSILSEYKFENNVNDSVGVNNATPTDITYAAGIVGQTGVFNGTTSKAIIPNTTGQLSFESNPFSVTVLYKPTNIARQFVIDSGGTGGKQEWYIYYRDGFLWFYMESVGDGSYDKIYITSVNSYPINTVMHITATCDGSNTKEGLSLYVDGVLQEVNRLFFGTYTGMVNRGGDIHIGGHSSTTGYKVIGQIDCVRFWNKELTAQESMDISSLELAGTDINP